MSRLEWNDNFGQQFVSGAQAILDDVLRDTAGQDTATVKNALRTRFQSEMNQRPGESLLDKFAERLAAGQRVVIR